MTELSRISQLAKKISESTAIFNSWLRDNGVPQPSFDSDGPLLEGAFPPEIAVARIAIADATIELCELTQGPRASLMDFVAEGKADSATLYLNEIPRKVPLDDPNGITYQELAKKTGINERALTRILRNAIAWRIFREEHPGVVTHSAASRLWATEAVTNDWIGFATTYGAPSIKQIGHALARFPNADEPDEAGASLHHASLTGERAASYEILAKSPEISRLFGASMTMFQKDDGWSLRHVVDNYDWSALPEGSTVVDLGGSHGELARAVAAKHSHLSFVVQDLPNTIDTAPPVPSHLKIEMRAHSFFEPQPVRGAKVYVFRWIFHNWPDKYCHRILDALVPAMEDGSRVLIIDVVLPPTKTLPNKVEREVRFMDIAMLAWSNAGDRPAEEWERLLKDGIDARFEYQGIRSFEGSRLSFIELVWHS